MFLKQTKQANGRVSLTIVHGYREPGTKKSKQKQVVHIGFLDELIDKYEDPIAHFKHVAKKMNFEANENKIIKLELDMTEEHEIGTNDIKNIGFIALSEIYHKLGIHKFLINRMRGLSSNIPLNNIMKLLVYERILHPGSKIAAYENKNLYFENFDFNSRTMYRAFSKFAKYKKNLLLELYENISMLYGRDITNVFYDVTNYYFHIDEQTDLIRKGMGKDKKGKPIIQMGLLIDNAGIPITYKLFSGNTTDFETLLPILSELKAAYNLDRVIVVADKGLNSGSNKAYNIIKGDGYIFSRSIRGTKANQDIKKFVLSNEGYREYTKKKNKFKIKSKVMPTEITVENIDGKKEKVLIDEKHVAFYSEKYDKRAKHKRSELIEKANKLINSPSRYAKAGSYGAMKYIIGMKLDKKTGELTPVKDAVNPFIDTDLILEEEKYDGYYSIVTSELDMSDEEIIERYHGLWKIEETFRITKTSLETRPVFVRNKDSIEAHFLSCFLALVIIRILEKELGASCSIDQTISSLNKLNAVHLKMNYYKSVYYDEILDSIKNKLGINFKKKYLTLDEIKKMISDTK